MAKKEIVVTRSLANRRFNSDDLTYIRDALKGLGRKETSVVVVERAEAEFPESRTTLQRSADGGWVDVRSMVHPDASVDRGVIVFGASRLGQYTLLEGKLDVTNLVAENASLYIAAEGHATATGNVDSIGLAGLNIYGKVYLEVQSNSEKKKMIAAADAFSRSYQEMHARVQAAENARTTNP